MLKYFFQRLIAAMFTFAIIIMVVFFVISSMPGSIFEPGSDARIPPRMMALIEEKYHINDPLPVQFGYFVRDYTRLDFGRSITVRPDVPVFSVIRERLNVTVQLNIFAAFFVLPMGMIFGITMALRKNTMYDHTVSSLVILFISVPSFVLAALLQYFLAGKLQWFPILVSTDTALTARKFYSMILPILALSFGGIASFSRMLRAELAETLTSDFMLLAKAKGLKYSQTIWRHALRNAFTPMSATFLYLFLGILGSSLVIERIFSVPGLSGVLIQAINTHDHPLSLAVVYFYVMIGLFMAILADLSYGIVDPRIRVGGRKDG